MTATHTDVVPFLAATEAAVLDPHTLAAYLDGLDDATLDAVRALGEFLARWAAAEQGHRRFQQMWNTISVPAPLGPHDATEFAAALADLPTGEPEPDGRHAGAGPAAELSGQDPADDPAAVTAVIPAYRPAGGTPAAPTESETA